MRLSLLLLAIFVAAPSFAAGQEASLPETRRVPPLGVQLAKPQRDALLKEIASVRKDLQRQRGHADYADVAVLVKAADYAVRHRELYNAKDTRLVDEILSIAKSRVDALAADKTPWSLSTGRTVRGYRSSIDHSFQPYVLEIPEDFDFSQPAPLYVWLHGRGDKITDLHFIHRLLARPGRIHPAGAIVVHPFGRHCMGFKSAGEIDVLECVEEVKRRYKIDEDRIVLMGFSMGGAGVWHIGSHYPDRWVAMSPGAGFAETARYNRLTKDKYPPWYEQRLWGLYDAPGYVRNLFNLPVAAYSGEKDKQIQAARVMEEAFAEQDRTLPHIIGPGMGHKYHPDSLAEILHRMNDAVRKGRNRQPKTVHLQTRTLRYPQVFWVKALRLGQHWQDARIDATIVSDQLIQVATKNVRGLRLSPKLDVARLQIEIDGQTLSPPESDRPLRSATLIRSEKRWQWRSSDTPSKRLAKEPGLQGPIDDAFMSSFLIVPPERAARHPRIEQWTRSELAYTLYRWTTLYRGKPPVRSADRLTEKDIRNHHLVLFGDPQSNRWIRRVLEDGSLPLKWSAEQVKIGDRSYPADSHAPLLIYRNPLNPAKYVVINSGPTHREGHDRTNSLQNPKLPDWAIIDVRTPASDTAPGKVAAADFFDEFWQLRQEP